MDEIGVDETWSDFTYTGRPILLPPDFLDTGKRTENGEAVLLDQETGEEGILRFVDARTGRPHYPFSF
jgi:hypothetical protein